MNVPNQSFEGDGTLYKMQQEAIRRAYEYDEKNQKRNSPENTHKNEYKIKKEDFIDENSYNEPRKVKYKEYIKEPPCETCNEPKKKGGLFGGLFGGGGKKDNTLFGNFTIEDLIILGIIFLILYNSDEEIDWLLIIALGFLFITGL